MSVRKTPHDDFFYKVMSRKEQAMTFFQRYLPKEVLDRICLERLELAESKHLSDEGVNLYNDVLYRCAFTQEQQGYLFAMCEHQSTPKAQMPLRLLKYNVATIEKHLKQNGGTFPIIVNIVLYHGHRPWKYSTQFADYYADPALGRKFLNMAPFTLVNVSSLSPEDTRRDSALGFCFEALRCTSCQDPYEAFASALQDDVFKNYFNKVPKELRTLTLIYLVHCIDRSKHSMEDLAKLVSYNSQDKTEIMTSIAQAIRQEGIQQGMQQGIQTRNLEIARNMLFELHLDVETVSKATGLTKKELKKLHQKIS